MPLLNASLAVAKWHGGTPEPNRGGHGSGVAEAEEDVSQVLGGDGDDGSPSAQSLTNAELVGQDPL